MNTNVFEHHSKSCIEGGTEAFEHIKRSLTESETINQALLDLSDAAISITRMRDGIIMLANRVYCQLTGLPRDQVIGRTHAELNVIANKTDLESFATELWQQGEVHKFEMAYETKSGQSYPTQTSGKIIKYQGRTCALTHACIADKLSAAIDAMRENEFRIRNLLDSISDSYYEVDLKGNLTFFNMGLVTLLSLPAENLKGTNIKDYIICHDIAKIEAGFKAVLQGTQRSDLIEFAMQPHDGSTIQVETSLGLLKDNEGRPKGLFGILRDRTEQRMAQMALQKSEEQYRLLVDNANDGIYITQNGCIRYNNPKTSEITGYADEELKDFNFADLVYSADRQTIYEVSQRRLSEGHHPEAFTFRILNKNKSLLWVELNSICINWEGRPAGLNFLRDVTHQKQTEQRLLQAQKMEAIGTLAGGVAHDFNNILSAIIGFTELALDDAGENTLQESNLKEVHIAGQRAKDLVHQILAYARRSEENLSPVMVGVIAKEVLKLIRSSIPSTIEIDANIVSKSSVMGHATQIHQIIMNLCTNAAQAMENSGGILSVELTDMNISPTGQYAHMGLSVGTYVQLKVSDTGCGIAPEIIDNIFDPYYTTKGLGEGTGMGLSVVQGIVENYGGKISVESRLGKGSVFCAFLPVCESHIESVPTMAKSPSGSGERILLVDDEPSIVRMAGQLLQNAGYQVTTQTNSTEALKLFAGRPEDFDLIITDMTMPNMTGDRLAAEMMRIRPNIPVIINTGYSKKITEEIALQMGFKAFVLKPINRDDYLTTIRKVLDDKYQGNDVEQVL